MTKPSKQALLDCISQGMNIHAQAKHFKVTLWTLTQWRRSYHILGIRKKSEHTPDYLKKKRDHNRLTPVNILGVTNYDYAARLERDFQKIHKQSYSSIPYESFRTMINQAARARGVSNP